MRNESGVPRHTGRSATVITICFSNRLGNWPASLAVRRPRPSVLVGPGHDGGRRCLWSLVRPRLFDATSRRRSALGRHGRRGGACIWLARTVAPSWDEPALCFLIGGLLGVLLYKVWVAALSSLAGALLITYSILGLLSSLVNADITRWAEQQAPLLNWVCASAAVLGVLTQLLMERRRRRRLREKAAEREAEEFARDHPPPPPPRRWWELGRSKAGSRRAA
jgi:hypothetical protein